MSTRIDIAYRCPDVPAGVPDDVAWCNYTDCRGCTTQRHLRVADLPDPSHRFDDRDPEEREVDPYFESGLEPDLWRHAP